MEIFKKHISRKEALEFVFAGGVASNNFIKESFKMLCRKKGFGLSVPSKILCTDNAAMIAAAGLWSYQQGEYASWDMDAQANLDMSVLNLTESIC